MGLPLGDANMAMENMENPWKSKILKMIILWKPSLIDDFSIKTSILRNFPLFHLILRQIKLFGRSSLPHVASGHAWTKWSFLGKQVFKVFKYSTNSAQRMGWYKMNSFRVAHKHQLWPYLPTIGNQREPIWVNLIHSMFEPSPWTKLTGYRQSGSWKLPVARDGNHHPSSVNGKCFNLLVKLTMMCTNYWNWWFLMIFWWHWWYWWWHTLW